MQKIHEPPGEQGTGAAEGDERVVARVEPALDRHLLDGVGLVPGRDLENALGGPSGLEAETRRERGESFPRALAHERDLSAQQARRDAPQQQMRVGHRGLGAAAPIAERAGVGARAARAHLEPAVGRDPRDTAAAGAHGDDVDHRHLDREPTDRAVGGEAGLSVLDEAHVGARATGIRGEHTVDARGLREQARTERAGRGAAQDRRDRLGRDLPCRDDAAVRLHHVEGHARPEFGVEARLDGAHVGGDARLHEGVHERRHRALVLTVLGQHLGGDRHMRSGVLTLEDGAHALLVLRIGVGMNEAHADGVDAVVTEPAGHLDSRRLAERAQHLAAKIEPLGHFAHEVQRNDAVGLDPEVGVAVPARHGLPRDLQHVAEAQRRDEAESRKPLLQERVGRHGGAVTDGSDGRGRRGVVDDQQDLVDPVEHADRRVVRRRRCLGREDLAGSLVDGHDVGERAAGVDADAEETTHGWLGSFGRDTRPSTRARLSRVYEEGAERSNA